MSKIDTYLNSGLFSKLTLFNKKLVYENWSTVFFYFKKIYQKKSNKKFYQKHI